MAYTALHRSRVAAGLCPCGNHPPRPGRKTCQACADYDAGIHRGIRAARKAMGRCTTCGNGIPAPGRTTCGNCREADRDGYIRRGEADRQRIGAGNRRRRAAAIAAGLCRNCLKRKPKADRLTCPRCLARETLRKAGKRIKFMGPRPAPVWHWPKGKPMPADHPWRRLDRAGVRQTQWKNQQRKPSTP